MLNMSMKEALESGDCIDVATIGVYVAETDTYVLNAPVCVDLVMQWSTGFGVDYAEGCNERWIWSIGKRKSDGVVEAAFDTRFFQNPDFDCLWLR